MTREAVRLADLASYRIMDSAEEATFDRIAELAASIFDCPIVVLSLLDDDREWFKARVGLTVREFPRSLAFSQHAFSEPPLLVVPDARLDRRFEANPLVVGEPHFVFYAGGVIRSAAGVPLGALSVIDYRRRDDWSSNDSKILLALARLAESELERRKMTLEAEDAVRRFKDFADTSADWYWEMDREHRFTSFYGNLPDMPLHEKYLGRRRWDAHEPQTDPTIWKRHREDLEARRSFRNLELEAKTRSGDRIVVSISGKPAFDENGQFAGFRGSSRDVTRRRINREIVERSEANFRAIFESHPDPMWVADADNFRFLLVNDAAVELYGFSRAEFLAMRTWEIVEASDQGRFQAFLENLDKTAATNTEWRHCTKSGQILTVSMRGQGILFSGDQARLLVARDHTELRATEAELQRHEEQRRQSQRLEVLGQLTGGVAHDFNNMLTVILGNLERIEEAAADQPGLLDIAQTARHASERAASLTSRLLAFARQQPLKPVPTDVGASVTTMKRLLHQTLSEMVELEVEIAEDAGHALVDPAQLESAILNLCVNSRDAMACKSVIGSDRLAIRIANRNILAAEPAIPEEVAPGQYVMVTISDNGCGMSQETIARAFEPFFTTKDVGKGSGLGLSMVYGFVKQSGGHVTIESKAGQGTTVGLYLRRTDMQPEGHEQPLDLAELGGIGTILLAEDDELVRVYASRQLESLGYRVVAVRDGPRALAALEELGQVDLLLTDMVMPGGLNGRQLAEGARRLQPGLKVLISSGYSADAANVEDFSNEGIVLMNKPYRRRELAETVRRILAQP